MRLTPEKRRHVIITAALRIAREKGLVAVNHGDVAKRCSLPTTARTVRHYFNSRDELWRAVVSSDEGFKAQADAVGLEC